MKNFISQIKKIPTDELIFNLSEKSISMFVKGDYLMPINIPAIHYGQKKTLTITLTAWDILDIEFLSIKESNDYRHSSKAVSFDTLIDLYRNYDNERSAKEGVFKNSNADELFRTLMGMTAEQFLYQNPAWIFEKFNRDYYILLAATNFEHRPEINVNAIVKGIFGFSADDYIALLLMVLWLCRQHPDPLTAPKELYCKKDNTIFIPDNLFKIVNYYSCTYEDLRASFFKKQLLYSKPFIKTQKSSAYLSASVFAVSMLVGNGLYWLIRDYYRNQGSQSFINAFGYLFEDYIKDLSTKYCLPSEWSVLPTGTKKGADFTFNFGAIAFLVESKSSLIGLDVKQQIPNLNAADTFFNRTIKKAYNQLNSSYSQLVSKTSQPIIKVILLYDEFSNSAIIEAAANTILGTDPSCFIMTIREFEILLYLHKNDKETEHQVLNEILLSSTSENHRKNIHAIYNDLSLHKNPHLDGEMDYFSKLMKHFEKELK